jgi:hypothetical protein
MNNRLLNRKEVTNMTMRELTLKVRELCEKEGVDFLFITEGASSWSVSHDAHINAVAEYHQETEDEEP